MLEQSTVVVILHSFDLIDGSSFDSFRVQSFEHRTDLSAIRLNVINSVVVSVAILSECDFGESGQLIEVSFGSVLEFVLNDNSQRIILEVMIEYVDDVLIEKIAVRSSNIEFIFEEDFQGSI